MASIANGTGPAVTAIFVVLAVVAFAIMASTYQRRFDRCPHCQARYRKGATVCPHCARDLA